MYCRDLSHKYEHVYVVSGPLWLPEERDKDKRDEGVAGDGGESFKEKMKRLKMRNKVVRHQVSRLTVCSREFLC